MSAGPDALKISWLLLIRMMESTSGKYFVLTGMALSLGIRFSGITLPVAVAMTDFPELVAGSVQKGEGFWTALDCTGLDSIRAVGNLITRDNLQQLND